MKQINTLLTERQFLTKLESTCTLKTRFNNGYHDIETFVYKIKDNKFWLGKHHPEISRGAKAFSAARLNCKYFTNANGRITINYRKGKHPLDIILHVIAFIIGLYFSANSLISYLKFGETKELIFPILLIILGVLAFIIKPKKEWNSLEQFLLKICNIK